MTEEERRRKEEGMTKEERIRKKDVREEKQAESDRVKKRPNK
jgi:hypothetical protein